MEQQAREVASKGRYGDSMLVHMNPIEVAWMHENSPTGLTINPETGQPEAFLPLLGALAGGWLGSSMGATLLGSAALTGLGSFAGSMLQGDSLKQGLMTGLMSFGTAGLMGALGGGAEAVTGGATPATTAATATTATPAGLDPYGFGSEAWHIPPPTGGVGLGTAGGSAVGFGPPAPQAWGDLYAGHETFGQFSGGDPRYFGGLNRQIAMKPTLHDLQMGGPPQPLFPSQGIWESVPPVQTQQVAPDIWGRINSPEALRAVPEAMPQVVPQVAPPQVASRPLVKPAAPIPPPTGPGPFEKAYRLKNPDAGIYDPGMMGAVAKDRGGWQKHISDVFTAEENLPYIGAAGLGIVGGGLDPILGGDQGTIPDPTKDRKDIPEQFPSERVALRPWEDEEEYQERLRRGQEMLYFNPVALPRNTAAEGGLVKGYGIGGLLRSPVNRWLLDPSAAVGEAIGGTAGKMLGPASYLSDEVGTGSLGSWADPYGWHKRGQKTQDQVEEEAKAKKAWQTYDARQASFKAHAEGGLVKGYKNGGMVRDPFTGQLVNEDDMREGAAAKSAVNAAFAGGIPGYEGINRADAEFEAGQEALYGGKYSAQGQALADLSMSPYASGAPSSLAAINQEDDEVEEDTGRGTGALISGNLPTSAGIGTGQAVSNQSLTNVSPTSPRGMPQSIDQQVAGALAGGSKGSLGGTVGAPSPAQISTDTVAEARDNAANIASAVAAPGPFGQTGQNYSLQEVDDDEQDAPWGAQKSGGPGFVGEIQAPNLEDMVSGGTMASFINNESLPPSARVAAGLGTVIGMAAGATPLGMLGGVLNSMGGFQDLGGPGINPSGLNLDTQTGTLSGQISKYEGAREDEKDEVRTDFYQGIDLSNINSLRSAGPNTTVTINKGDKYNANQLGARLSEGMSRSDFASKADPTGINQWTAHWANEEEEPDAEAKDSDNASKDLSSAVTSLSLDPGEMNASGQARGDLAGGMNVNAGDINAMGTAPVDVSHVHAGPYGGDLPGGPPGPTDWSSESAAGPPGGEGGDTAADYGAMGADWGSPFREGGLIKKQGYANGGQVQPQQDPILMGAVAAIQGHHPEPQKAIQQFIQVYGQERFAQLRQQVIAETTAQQRQGSGLGAFVRGQGDGLSDSIPANIDGQEPVALSDGEVVVPADVVSGLGNGSSEAGAEKIEEMGQKVRQKRTGSKKQPRAVDASQLITGMA